MEWRPIESAPKDGTRVDLWVVGDANPPWPPWGKTRDYRATDCWWVSKRQVWCHGPRAMTIRKDLPTHWMPLPPPPSPPPPSGADRNKGCTMSKKYLLVTDATAEEVKAQTGLDARDTRLGAFLENPEHRIEEAMKHLDWMNQRLQPSRCTCTGILHRPKCPMAMTC